MGFVIGGEIDKKIPKIEKNYFDKPKQFFSEILSKIKQFKFSKNILLISGAIFIIMAFFLIEYFFHKTEIILTLPSQIIEKNLVVDDLQPDISTKSTSFSVSKKTTGNTEVGEKAKGEVTIHNFSSSEIQFDKGTKIVTSNLFFMLDSDTKVSSGSLTSDKQSQFPGKTKTKVTAETIGDKYNIAANNTFKIEELPEADYFAINENTLTGGSKKEVKNVSEEDILALEKEVQKKAKAYQKDKINSDFIKTHLLINQLGSIKFGDLNYDKELGEEATTLTLKTKANITNVGLNNIKLQKRILPELTKVAKKNYVVDKNNLKIETTSAKQNKDNYIFNLDIVARASQKIDLSEFRSDINGRDIDKIEKILSKKYKIEKLEVNVDHPIGFFKKFVSLINNNIDLKVIYN